MRAKVALFVFAGFSSLAVILLLAGFPPLNALEELLRGCFASPSAISGTLQEATPLLITGIAVFVALQAGLFNIGADGQFVVGALSAVFVAQRIGGAWGILFGTIAGVVAGGMWALPASLIKAYRGGHEVITTIMMNSIAGFLTSAIVAGPMRNPNEGSPTTSFLAPSSRLPNLVQVGNFELNSATVIALLLALALAYWLRATISGYEVRAVGANPIAAEVAGISRRNVQLWTLTASGAIAGLAGAVQALGFEGRFYENFSPGYGFNALGVALLAGAAALALPVTAFVFGVLAKGGVALATNGVPKGITGVALGMLILVAAVLRYKKANAHD